MHTLCIDVGNSNTHYGLASGQSVVSTGHFTTKFLKEASLKDFLELLAPLSERANRISFCSVVPSINENLETHLAGFKLPIFHLTHKSCIGLTLAYPNPSEIGEDRIANAIAAQEYFNTPSIIIDMGTTVTFDIISSKGYEGGVIAPGLDLMIDYLHERTALLPKISSDDLVSVYGSFGKSTKDAMKLGVVVGFSGMIQSILNKVTDDLLERGESNLTVLSTGGSFANLTKDWAQKSHFVGDLTLIGLAEAAQRV